MSDLRTRRALLLSTAGLVMIASASCAGGNNNTASGSGGSTTHGSSGGSSGLGTGGAPGDCTPCLTTASCGAGYDCGQFAGDTYCAADCTGGQTCGEGYSCTPVNTTEGHAVSVCIPLTASCGQGSSSSSSSTSSTSSTSSSTSTSSSGSYGGSCAHSPCAAGVKLSSSCDPCVTSTCAGDSYCCDNKWDAQCVTEATAACGCGTTTSSSSSSGAGSTSSSSSSSSSSTSSGTSGGGTVGPGGGTLDTLSFAIVGDTRPANVNDTSGYPTAIITKIWQDVQNQSPRPAFGVTTGDYMFADPTSGQAAPQLQLYLTARQSFTNTVFAAMGNHECNGYTASNCGPGNTDGVTDNYTQFLSLLLAPLNVTKPYYVVNVNGTNNAWTAKFVFIAANAWDSAQSSWLASTLSQPTTYTFVIRHESSSANTAPGVTPSDTIIAQHPVTLKIFGHTHTYQYSTGQVIVGNGGAPVTGGVNYGYVIGRQQANGSILFTSYDYSTNASIGTFTVQ